MAYLAYQRSVCETCGTRAAEWEESQGGDRFAYVAEPYRCVGCEVIEMEREHIPDGPDARGLKIGLKPREAS